MQSTLTRTFPNLFYGWVIAISLAISEPVSWGILFYGFGALLTPMQQEMGWSQAWMTGAFSVALLVSGVVAVPVGRWLDQHGARGLMTLGSCLAVVAVIAWAQVQTLVGFYVVWAAIGAIMAMVLYEPAFVVIATWFVKRRNTALTVLTFGGGLASVIFVPLATWLVQLYGWRSALWILAGVLAVTTIPLHALILRRNPAAIGTVVDGEVSGLTSPLTPSPLPPNLPTNISVNTAMHHPAFWWLTLAFTLSTFGAIALSVHLLPYLNELGYPAAFAALTASVLGGSQIPGRLIFGPLADRFSLRSITALLFTLMMIGLLILLFAPTAWSILLGGALFGMGSGASSPARAALVAEFYGVANYGSINGVMTLIQTLVRAAAPLGMGLLHTWAQVYTPVFVLLVCVAAGAALSILCARQPEFSSIQ